MLGTFFIKGSLLFQEQQISENKPHMGLLYNWVQVRIPLFLLSAVHIVVCKK
jgi:hypothetical protein